MTLGEKIRNARKYRGLSQERLSEKLCVSRSAIAKWETDKGMPDVENLKLLAQLLGVSLDSLLDDREEGNTTVFREAYQLAAYGRGCKKVKKDRMMRQKFPDARICTLLGRPKLMEEAMQLDSTLGFLTSMPLGSPQYVQSLRDMDRDFYIVEHRGEQIFVTVSDDYLDICSLGHKEPLSSFQLGGWIFVKCNYLADE